MVKEGQPDTAFPAQEELDLNIELFTIRVCRSLGKSEEDPKDPEVKLLKSSIELARSSGDEKLSHSLGVARIIYEWGIVDLRLLIAALTHEIPSNSLESFLWSQGEVVNTIDEILEIHRGIAVVEAKARSLGLKDAFMVNGFEVANRLVLSSPNLPSILLVLADRLDRCQNIQRLNPDEQAQVANEMSAVYSPLCSYLGLERTAGKLNDRVFEIAHPEEFQTIKEELKRLYSGIAHPETVTYQVMIGEKLGKLLKEKQILALRIDSRTKSIASIWAKQQRYLEKGMPEKADLATFSDITGLRIVVPTVSQCYQVLEMMRKDKEFLVLDERIDNYIENPKPTGYQALHVVVRFGGGPLAEVQILTPEMFITNQWGKASHFRAYEAAGKKEAGEVLPSPWQKAIALFIASSLRGTERKPILVRIASPHTKEIRLTEMAIQKVTGEVRKQKARMERRLPLSQAEFETSLEALADALIEVLGYRVEDKRILEDNFVSRVLNDKLAIEGKVGIKRTILLALEELCFFWEKAGAKPEDILFHLLRGGYNLRKIMARIAINTVGISHLSPEEKDRFTKEFVKAMPMNLKQNP
ncbi:MAG: HD domain-containing protein [Patescibacteria group bacterium]